MILAEKLQQADANSLRVPLFKVTESITVPGQAMDLAYAMKQYKKGSLIERAKAFYESKGFEMPEFNMMSRVEKLQALAVYRKLAKESFDNIQTTQNEILQQREEKAAKAAAERKSDRGEQPDAK